MTFPTRNRKVSSGEEAEDEIDDKENKSGQNLGRDFTSMIELFGGFRRDRFENAIRIFHA